MEEIVLHITGHPRSQPRGRWVDGRMVSSTGKVLSWLTLIERAAREKVRELTGADRVGGGTANAQNELPAWVSGAVRIDIDWYFPVGAERLHLVGKPSVGRCDKDNLEKAVYDALQRAKLLKNDAYVVQGCEAKWWSQHGGMVITVTPAMNSEAWQAMKGGKGIGKDE